MSITRFNVIGACFLLRLSAFLGFVWDGSLFLWFGGLFHFLVVCSFLPFAMSGKMGRR